MGRRLTAQEKQRRAKAAAKAKEPLDPRYDANPREAARAIDGEAYRARGETPPWEEEEELLREYIEDAEVEYRRTR